MTMKYGSEFHVRHMDSVFICDRPCPFFCSVIVSVSKHCLIFVWTH